MKYKNLEIIGSSHIAKQSLDEVKEAFDRIKPDIVGVELDKKRLMALMSKNKGCVSLKDIFRIGLKGWLFALFGHWAEHKLGKMVGVMPGSEMKLAVKLANKNKAKIALIDQDIEITLKKFSKALSWKEKWNFFVDIIKAVVFRKMDIKFDLTKVPEKKIIKKLINKVKKRYPNVYKVLIKDRNKVLAANLRKIMDENEDKQILAILGAGHEEDVLDMLKKHKIEVVYEYSVQT